jgi:enoyl-CoA hydratase/carnithine racemase
MGGEVSNRYSRVERDGHVTVVTLDRPENLNALHADANLELSGIFDEFEADPDQWVAIVTGAGRAFCAGNDLKVTAESGLKRDDRLKSGFAGLTSRLKMNKPTIAAVNGVAMGGGFELALACDLIVAAEDAVFALPEPRFGLAALGGGVVRLPQQIGVKRAMSIILTGRRVSAAEGKELGFVNDVAPRGQALDVAKRWAGQITELSPMSIRASKEAVRLSGEMPIEQALDAQFDFPAMRAMFESDDYREGPRAFVEKRPANWKGA